MWNVATPSFAWSDSRQANREACRWRDGRERLEEAKAFGKAERQGLKHDSTPKPAGDSTGE